MTKHVFISYSTQDTAAATEVRDGLEAAGLACWMAPRDIAPGLDYAEQIIDAIEACLVLVLLLSESSNQSLYVRNEVERAIAKRKLVIPLRIHNVTPSRSLEFFISNAQWIEAWQVPLEGYIAPLISAIRNYHDMTLTSHNTIWPSNEPVIPFIPRHNLPAATTPFVGRETELANLNELTRDPTTRLTTILGSGGMGKTRLAVEVGLHHLTQSQRFANGVFFVHLGLLRAVEYIVPTIADALNFVMDTARQIRPPEQQLLDYLRSKQLLLILDNFEHLLGSAELVSNILQAAPEVHILVTSRERLHIRSEQIYSIHGFDIPTVVTSKDVAQHAAVQLFVDRARRVHPGFVLGSENLLSIVEICRLVGGVPLALELAAGWVDMMPISEIVTELQQSLDLLETKDRDVPERQRSMRAVFDYSWQLLSQTEQMVLAKLAVFRGGFDRHAAAQVTEASMHTLSSLASKSLLEIDAVGYRYSIHAIIHQFSAQALALMPQIENNMHNRHSAYYAERLQQRELDLKSANQMAALTEIETEHENMRSGWKWAIQQGLVGNLDKAMESLCLFYEWRGRYQEGAEVCRAAVSQKTVQAEPNMHVRSLIWLATFDRMLGHRKEAHEYLQQSLTLVESGVLAATESDTNRAALLLVMSDLAYDEGQAQQARELSEQSLALFVALNYPWHVSKAGLRLSETIVAFSISGDVRARQKRLAEAREVIQRSLEIYRGLSDRTGTAESVCVLGWIMHLLGYQDEALSLLQESIAIYDQIGAYRSRSTANGYTSIVYSALGDYDNARRHVELAVHLAREYGDPYQLGMALFELGKIAIIDRALGEADHALQESIAILRGSALRGTMATGLAFLAYADYSQNRKLEMHQHILEALQVAHETQYNLPYLMSLPLVALLLTERSEDERAVELYTQALAHLCNGYKHRWFEDMVGQHVAAAAATLPPEVVAAAQERGWQRNLWETAEELLHDIKDWTW